LLSRSKPRLFGIALPRPVKAKAAKRFKIIGQNNFKRDVSKDIGQNKIGLVFERFFERLCYLKLTLTFSARDLLVTMIFAMNAPFVFVFIQR